MPNHIKTFITADNIDHEFWDKFKNGERLFDFNKIIPTPDDIYQGDLGEQEKLKYGDKTWYEWNIKNWGTKWNAYSVGYTYSAIHFETAWGHPFPVIKALSKMFPKIEFLVAFADEDLGSNLGAYKIKNDKAEDIYMIDNLFDQLFAEILHGLQEEK